MSSKYKFSTLIDEVAAVIPRKLNSSKYLFGHCRVVLGIQKFIHGRWACFPVKQRIYRLKKVCK